MNIYSKLLEEESKKIHFENPLEKFDFNILKVKNYKKFHMDCQQTKKKLCFCPFGEESLMPENEKRKFSALATFLTNSQNGIKEENYFETYKKKLFLEEKAKSFQSVNDFCYHLPKFNTFMKKKMPPPQTEAEKEKQKKNEIKAICYICLGEDLKKMYYVPKEFIESEYEQDSAYVCHECAVKVHPELLPSTKGKPRKRQPLYDKDSEEHEKTEKKLSPEKELSNENDCLMTNSYTRRKKPMTKKNFEKICHWQFCQKNNNYDDMLTCKICERSFHANCCQPPLKKAIVERYDWYCNECKVCCKCLSNIDENKLLICDLCDRAFHLQCLNPVKNDIPDSQWYCEVCEKCASCKTPLFNSVPTEKEIQKIAKNIVRKWLLCDKCYVFFAKNEYCPVCVKVIPEDSEGNFVFCDVCNLWLHAPCEKITGRRMQEIKNIETYKCTICRGAKELIY